ncbi:hypothetical protein D1Z90_20945 [Motilimonas pumila]|uniref:Uncharacterized protein n=1 Tax=Motilimonas pumila TaxID=2303987 RepID=A0A418Y8T7_9GAMM|nr:hypothetical protein D1Z90_20945 [Motilimonas pumila]
MSDARLLIVFIGNYEGIRENEALCVREFQWHSICMQINYRKKLLIMRSFFLLMLMRMRTFLY